MGAMAGAAGANVATQGVNILMGQQSSFSWSSLAASAISAGVSQGLTSGLTGDGGMFASSDAATKLAVNSTTRALVSAATRVAIQGGKVSWEAVAADTITGMIQGHYASQGSNAGAQQPKDKLATDKSRADLGLTTESNWSEDMQAALAIDGADRSTVRINSGSSTEGNYVNGAGQRVHRSQGSDTSGYEQTMRSLHADADAELVSLGLSGNGPLVIEITGSGTGPSAKYAASEPDTTVSFMRGYNGEYRSVMEGEAPLAETVGRYAGAAVDSFKNFGDAMTGAGRMRDAMGSWQRGDIGLSLLQGGMAFAEAGSTVFGLGVTGAVRSAGTATLRAEAGALADSAAVRANVLGNIEESQAARASSGFEKLGRYETAYDFYRQGGFSADRALGHLEGIDLSKPVMATELIPGKQYLQYPLNGKIGNYFAPLGTPAEMLGINPAGRIPTLFTPSQTTPALQSTAAKIVDNWTVPGKPFVANGGGTQFFVPNKQFMLQVPKP